MAPTGDAGILQPEPATLERLASNQADKNTTVTAQQTYRLEEAAHAP